MTDTATSVVIDSMHLVAQNDTTAALALLHTTDIPHPELQRAALTVMAFVLSGDGAPARFAELRTLTHELAMQHGAQDRQVILNLETISTAQALAEGDRQLASAIVAGSTLTAIDSAWCAVCLTGQAVHGWIGSGPEIWHGLRYRYGDGVA